MTDDPETLSYEFLAEIVRAPSTKDPSVRFKYIQDEVTEVAVSVEWWESLGRPDYIQVRVAPDYQ